MHLLTHGIAGLIGGVIGAFLLATCASHGAPCFHPQSLSGFRPEPICSCKNVLGMSTISVPGGATIGAAIGIGAHFFFSEVLG